MFPVIEGSWLPLCNPEKVSMAHDESCIGSHEAHFNCSSVHVQQGLVMHYEDVLLHFNFLRVPVEVNMKTRACKYHNNNTIGSFESRHDREAV